MQEQNEQKTSSKKQKKSNPIVAAILLVVVIFIFYSMFSLSSDSSSKSASSTTTQTASTAPTQNEETQIKEKENELTGNVQKLLDDTFADSDVSYKVEVQIGDISGDDLIGWINIYPQNQASWDLLSESNKKDFVATMVNVSRNEINPDLGSVYIKNEIRTLAEGNWSAWSGEAEVELK